MRDRFIHSLFLIGLLLVGAAPVGANSPDAVVRQVAGGVIERIEAERPALQANPALVYDLVDELVIPSFDFVSMAKWVLGKNWKRASPEQQAGFIEQFKALLVRTYARALLEYSGQQIRYLAVEQKPDSKLAVVKTELTSAGAQAFPVAYRMYRKDQTWKVVDVAVDGVSLVSTYRGSFAARIKDSGFDGLLQELASKNEKLAAGITD